MDFREAAFRTRLNEAVAGVQFCRSAGSALEEFNGAAGGEILLGRDTEESGLGLHEVRNLPDCERVSPANFDR
jgi:hypothetical protein